MDVREQVIRDCALLGDFAVKSVETLKAGDEKGVVRLYTGASQANVLMLLTDLVDHLAACSSPEDFPGDCAEVRRLRNYGRWAFGWNMRKSGHARRIFPKCFAATHPPNRSRSAITNDWPYQVPYLRTVEL